MMKNHFHLAQITLLSLFIFACSPLGQTKIGSEFHPGVLVSYKVSGVTISNSQVTSGSSVTITLSLKDDSGKPFISSLPNVALGLSGGTSTGTFGPVINNGDGSYRATFTGVTTGTPTTISASVNGTPVNSSLPTIQVTSANYSLSNSLITLSASTTLITNTVTATLTVHDASNNPLNSGGLSVAFSNSGGTSDGTWSATTDHNDGTYSAVFTSTQSGTATHVYASIAGNQITSTSPTITVSGVVASVPTSLAASATPGSVNLTWNASTGTTPITYTVKRATVSGGAYTTLQSTISATNYTDSTITHGTTYYYVVTSTNAIGTTANSSEVSVKAISSFAISSVSVNGGSALQVSWGAATGAAAYTLKYGTATGVYGTTVSTTATSPTTIGSLTPGTPYYFMVTATNAVGAGTGVNATAESTGVPIAAFTISSVTQPTSSQATITYGASTGSTSYTIKYGTSTGVYGTTFSSAATSPTTITGLTNGTQHYFMVYAVNASGSLAATSEATLIPIAAPSAPASPVATGGVANIGLTWTAATGSGTITYNVLRSTTSGSGYTTLVSGQSGTTYSDLTALNGTTYYYVIQAVNAGGTSSNSSEVSARPMNSFAISSVSVNGGSALQVSWAAASGAAAYTLKYGTATGVYGTTVSTSATSPTTIGSLTPGTTYYFMVVATNAVGAGTSVNATAESTGIPMAAFTMTAATRAGTSSSVTWATSAGSTSYILKYGTATGVYGTTVSSAATSATNVTGLTANTTYYFRVTAVNGSGSLDSTAELSQTTYAAFTNTWPFDAAPDPTLSYAFDATKIDFTGGVCRLTGSDQIDDTNTASGFAGGSPIGAVWDSTNLYLRLNQTGTPINNSELDLSWTPQYSNLLGYWPLNGTAGATVNNGDTITSTVGPNGTAVNVGTTTNFTYAAGQIKQGLSLGGTDSDYVNLGTTAAVRPSLPVTVMGWLKLSSTTGGTIIFSSDSTNTKFSGFTLGTGTQMSAQMGDNSGTNSTTNRRYKIGTTTLTTGVWYHVAAVIRSATDMSLYLNGVDDGGSYIGTGGTTMAYGTGTSAGIGYRNHGNIANLSGSVDEVALWSTALSAAEVQAIYSRQVAKFSGTFTSRVMDAYQTGQSWKTFSWIPTLPFFKELPDYASSAIQNESSTDYTSLVGSTGATGANDLMTGNVGLWHLNEAAGTSGASSVIDKSGKASHGTPINVTFGAAGRLNTAANFNGNSAINLSNPATLNMGTSDWSVSGWFRTKALVGSIIYKTRFAVNTGRWGVGFNTGGTLQAFLATSAANKFANTPLAYNDGQWHHFVAVWKRSGNMSLYMDGDTTPKVSTDISAASAENYSTTDIALIGAYADTTGTSTGGDASYTFFNGSIDEIGVWSRALHVNEISQLYRRGVNRIKQQVRICTASDCSDDTTNAKWKGPDGTNQTYFSELNNNTAPLAMNGSTKKGLPSMLFSDFTNPVGTSRYFQYRTILESDDAGTSCNYGSGATWCSPELKSVTVDPVHYDSASPTVIGKTGINFFSLASYAETLGTSCASGVGYNLGVGSAYSSATWYYWNGTTWVAANGTVAQSNTAADISTNAATFASTVGTGTVYFKAYLQSSGSSPCELSNIDLTGHH